MAKKGFVRTLPSQHETIRTQAEIAEVTRNEEAKRQKVRVRAAFDWLLKQENGRIVWAWLFNRCGYNKPTLLRMATGDIALLSTECVSAQRQIYLDARLQVEPELLMQAEYEAEYGLKLTTENKGEKKDA